jgi:hypothetical protein
MKAAHEQSVERRLAIAVADVSFAELEVTCKVIMEGPSADPQILSFKVLDLREKMNLNHLTDVTGRLLTLGLAGAPIVADYLTRIDSIDAGFPERLKQRFMNEYLQRSSEELRGDALFASLWEYACQGSPEFARQAAGLTVLTHLFEACEIFKRELPDSAA